MIDPVVAFLESFNLVIVVLAIVAGVILPFLTIFFMGVGIHLIISHMQIIKARKRYDRQRKNSTIHHQARTARWQRYKGLLG